MDWDTVLKVLGGVGLFLVGMSLVTRELRAWAGDALRKWLLRFTGGPWRALTTGAVATVLVQSSSATTLATIGFVAAGLVTFEQSIGVIFGANIGTTATSWIVAGLGLKVDVNVLALPLIGVGAFMHVFTKDRLGHIGLAMAGFGMIFVGIDFLQQGMSNARDFITPENLPSDTLNGRLVLIAIGAGMTAVMQASAAAMAMTLTALSAGAISLDQAACIAIGANIGTTSTALLGSLGAGTASRRSALAHVVFNVVTAAIAFALLPVFAWIVHALDDPDPALALAGFHSGFNLLGVAVLMPLHRPFAWTVRKLVKPRGPQLTRLLDRNAQALGPLAVEAVRQTVFNVLAYFSRTLQELFSHSGVTHQVRSQLSVIASSLDETEIFLTGIHHSDAMSRDEHQRLVSSLHAIDYLKRACALIQDHGSSLFLSTEDLKGSDVSVMQNARDQILLRLPLLEAWASSPQEPSPRADLEQLSRAIAGDRKMQRDRMLEATASGHQEPTDVSQYLEGTRRLDELAFYLWRVTERLEGERVIDAPGQTVLNGNGHA